MGRGRRHADEVIRVPPSLYVRITACRPRPQRLLSILSLPAPNRALKHRTALLPLVLAAAAPLLAAARAPAADPVLLRDGFDGENRERPTLMYADFRHWHVEDGTVDLIGAGSDWDFLPGNGLYVDLDGDRPDGRTFESGRLVSRRRFVLLPGTYELSFRLAGSQRGDRNTTRVRLGESYQEQFTLGSEERFTRYVRTIRVRRRADARLTFENLGADGYGLLLDDVLLRRR